MEFKFTEEKFKEIEEVLNARFVKRGNQYRMVVESDDPPRRLTLEIFVDIPMGKKSGNLVTVFTAASHNQLHFCTGFVASEVLGEVTFIAEHLGRLSGIIVEKDAACSVYSNIDSALVSGDFTNMGSEVMLSGVALSIAEHLLEKKE